MHGVTDLSSCKNGVKGEKLLRITELLSAPFFLIHISESVRWFIVSTVYNL